MPELEIIYPICAKGCRKIRDVEFLEDIRVLNLAKLANCPIFAKKLFPLILNSSHIFE